MEPTCALLKSKGYRNVFLVPLGILGVFPLHAAWTQEASMPTGRLYALDLINISYIPSAMAMIETRDGSNMPLDSILVIEDPTSTLQYAPIESTSVLGFFSNKDLLGGEAATRQEVLSRLPGNNVLHFSCHGFFNPEDPMQSGLMMANDETIAVFDIQQIQLDVTRLVVLSACETGLIGRRIIDEAIGFPCAWLGLGVPGIISSLWSVDDESTSILMKKFYEYLMIDKLGPGEALRQAQISVRDTLYSQPYFWAAFFFTGQ